jgi:glycosyltransferase involved in cell wall biosynthesis
MNILHFATTTGDGAGIAAFRQHEALRTARVDSRVIVCSDQADLSGGISRARFCPRSKIARWSDFLGVPCDLAGLWRKEVNHAEASGMDSFERFSLPFADYAPEDDPAIASADILHLHWVSDLVDFPRFFSRIRKPLVWTLHDQHPYLGGFHYDCDRDTAPSLAALEEKCFQFKKAAYAGHRMVVIGNSEWNTRLAKESGMFPAATRFETVYYPLDTSVYSPRDRHAAREAFALPSQSVLIGFACTDLQNGRKGLPELLDALRGLEEDVSLVSFGRSPDPSQIESMPHPWNHLGFLQEDRVKAAVYSCLDCFVVPSRAEAFGQTAIEAMACGIPVVATDVGGLSEAIDHGRAGVLVPPQQPEALRRAISDLIKDPEKRHKLSVDGRSHVVVRHAPESHAEQLIRLYNRLLP